jgi:hypothetical protein
MADVGPLGAFASLARVETRGVSESLDEPAGKDAGLKAFGDGSGFR